MSQAISTHSSNNYIDDYRTESQLTWVALLVTSFALGAVVIWSLSNLSLLLPSAVATDAPIAQLSPLSKDPEVADADNNKLDPMTVNDATVTATAALEVAVDAAVEAGIEAEAAVVDASSVDASAVEATALQVAAVEAAAVEAAALEAAALAAAEAAAVEAAAVEAAAVEAAAVEAAAIEAAAIEAAAIEAAAIEAAAIEAAAVEAAAVEAAAVEAAAVEAAAVEAAAVEAAAVEAAAVEAAAIEAAAIVEASAIDDSLEDDLTKGIEPQQTLIAGSEDEQLEVEMPVELAQDSWLLAELAPTGQKEGKLPITEVVTATPPESVIETLRREELALLSSYSEKLQLAPELGALDSTETPQFFEIFDLLFLYSETSVSVTVQSNDTDSILRNLTLAQQRGDRIVDHLVLSGLDRSRFNVVAESSEELQLGSHQIAIQATLEK